MYINMALSGNCRVKGNEKFISFDGIFISYAIKDDESSYYRGLGQVHLRGFLVKLFSGTKVILNPGALFDLEDVLKRGQSDLFIDVDYEISELKDALLTGLRNSVKNELGIDI